MNVRTSKHQRRIHLRILLFAIVVITIFFIHPSSDDPNSIWNLFSSRTRRKDHTETIRRIRNLQGDLQDKWPRTGYATHRHYNIGSLDRLAECLETDSCGPGEKTVIVLGSFHFGNSQNGHTSGEDIWAGSLVTILEANNFTLVYTYEPLETLLVYQALPDMIPLVFMESLGLGQCLDLGKMSRKEALDAKPAIEGMEDLAEDTKQGCMKRIGFEDGIPIQKTRVFHFWHGARHPIPGFTLSPENYTGWHGDSGNFYLGYHLEHCRHTGLPPSVGKHENRVFILGKRPEYFSEEKYAWPRSALVEITKDIGGGFEFVGAAGSGEEMPIKGIHNLGKMDKEKWGREVGKSAAMLGVGLPYWSPSPYDAWCMGVPFINPITRRDEKNPDDRKMWLTQHDPLRDHDPPYVYHVWKDDFQGLKDAVSAAVANPIPPYIPERMKRESVESRLLHLIHHNWTEEVEGLIRRGIIKGFADLDRGRNTLDGLLL